MLEIGMGTGKAAQPILDTHCHFVGIEPGENLAALAKERFRKYVNFSLYNQTLDHYGYRWMVHCPEGSMFRKQGVCIATAAGAGIKTKGMFYIMRMMQKNGWNSRDVEYWKEQGWAEKKRP